MLLRFYYGLFEIEFRVNFGILNVNLINGFDIRNFPDLSKIDEIKFQT